VYYNAIRDYFSFKTGLTPIHIGFCGTAMAIWETYRVADSVTEIDEEKFVLPVI
jgi:hypothetical protein